MVRYLRGPSHWWQVMRSSIGYPHLKLCLDWKFIGVEAHIEQQFSLSFFDTETLYLSHMWHYPRNKKGHQDSSELERHITFFSQGISGTIKNNIINI